MNMLERVKNIFDFFLTLKTIQKSKGKGDNFGDDDDDCDDGACFNNWKVESFSEDHLPGTRPNGDHDGDGDDLQSRF